MITGETLPLGTKCFYDMGEGVKVRCTYVGDREGWPMVTADADGPNAVAFHVMPSRVTPREAAQ